MERTGTEITAEDLARHSRKHGRKATHTLLSILGRRRPHFELVKSAGGQMMFFHLMARMDELLDKVVSNKASEEERMEYAISVDFLKHNTDMMVNYKKHGDKLKGVSNA